jgi:hypothetical protein
MSNETNTTGSAYIPVKTFKETSSFVGIEQSLTEKVKLELQYAEDYNFTEQEQQAILKITEILDGLDTDLRGIYKCFSFLQSVLTIGVVSPITFGEDQWGTYNIKGGQTITYHKRCPDIVKTKEGKILWFNPVIFVDYRRGLQFTGPFSDFVGYVEITVDALLPIKFFVSVEVEDIDHRVGKILSPDLIRSLEEICQNTKV